MKYMPRRLAVGACFAVALGWTAGAGTFESDDLSLTVAANGKIVSIIDRVTGVERIKSDIPQHQEYFCVLKVGEEQFQPTAFVQVDDLLIFTFANILPAPVITVRVRSEGRYLVIEIVGAVAVAGIDEIRFLNLWTRDSLDRTGERFMRYADEGYGRYLALYALTPYTRSDVGPNQAGGFLWASAHADLVIAPPLTTPRAVALMACDATPEAMTEIAALVEEGENIPLGMAARENPWLKRSGILLAEMSFDQEGILLECAKAAGAGRIMLFRNVWAEARRAYAPSELWDDYDHLRGWINECHAAGILVGAHCLPTIIPSDAREHIYAGCDARIRRDRTLALAAAVSASQTDGVIRTLQPPIGWPTADGERDVVINDEIIQYSGLRTTPPYGLLGPFIRAKNQTGPGGLGPQYHSSGSIVGRLVTAREAGYQWSLEDGGVELQCNEVAQAAAAAGFDYVYSDGMEELQEPHWYTSGRALELFRQRLEAHGVQAPFLESSTHRTGWLWPLVALHGQIDYYLYQASFKQEVDRNVEHMLVDAGDGALRQLGWAPLNHPFLPHATPDDMEYLLAKSAAYDVPVMVTLFIYSLPNWVHRDANWHLMKTYEELRLNGQFGHMSRLAARQPGKDFMHFADEAGNHYLTPVSLLNISANSPVTRGFITDEAIRGDWFVSLWPTADESLTLRLPGVAPDALVVRDYLGNRLELVVSGNDVLVPLTTRVYFQLNGVADPWWTFANATLTRGEP